MEIRASFLKLYIIVLSTESVAFQVQVPVQWYVL